MRRRFAIGISIVFVLGGGLHHGWLIVERAGVPGKAAKRLAERVATSLACGAATSAGGDKKHRDQGGAFAARNAARAGFVLQDQSGELVEPAIVREIQYNYGAGAPNSSWSRMHRIGTEGGAGD